MSRKGPKKRVDVKEKVDFGYWERLLEREGMPAELPSCARARDEKRKHGDPECE